jgi:hypothetical protein
MHPLVQTLPRIRNVAVPEFQHSVRFGQAALLQTVCSMFELITFRTVFDAVVVESFILNQVGSRLGGDTSIQL